MGEPRTGQVEPGAAAHLATWRFDLPIFQPETRAAWRAWLEEHHATARGVWVATWRRGTGHPTVAYDAIVEEALCFGWIDSTVNRLDEARNVQLVTPRKPRSAWARSNRDRVAALEAGGLMAPAGRRAVEVAKANGDWSRYEDAEALREPADLAAALDAAPGARPSWDGFAPSARKDMLWWLESAVRPETRARRVAAIVAGAVEGRRAHG